MSNIKYWFDNSMTLRSGEELSRVSIEIKSLKESEKMDINGGRCHTADVLYDCDLDKLFNPYYSGLNMFGRDSGAIEYSVISRWTELVLTELLCDTPEEALENRIALIKLKNNMGDPNVA